MEETCMTYCSCASACSLSLSSGRRSWLAASPGKWPASASMKNGVATKRINESRKYVFSGESTLNSVILTQRHNVRHQIYIFGRAYGGHGRIRNQQTSHRASYEHELLAQYQVGVVRIHPCQPWPSRPVINSAPSARSRALPPRIASNSASNSYSAGLRPAASGTVGYSG